MASLNVVTIMGNATRSAEMKQTRNGKDVAHFTLAINHRITRADGATEDKVTFVPVVAWGSWAKAASENIEKGSCVFVQGRLEIREYMTNEGQKRKAAEVVAQVLGFLRGRSEAPNRQEQFGDAGKFPEDRAGAAPAGEPVDEPMPAFGEGES